MRVDFGCLVGSFIAPIRRECCRGSPSLPSACLVIARVHTVIDQPQSQFQSECCPVVDTRKPRGGCEQTDGAGSGAGHAGGAGGVDQRAAVTGLLRGCTTRAHTHNCERPQHWRGRGTVSWRVSWVLPWPVWVSRAGADCVRVVRVCVCLRYRYVMCAVPCRAVLCCAGVQHTRNQRDDQPRPLHLHVISLVAQCTTRGAAARTDA